MRGVVSRSANALMCSSPLHWCRFVSAAAMLLLVAAPAQSTPLVLEAPQQSAWAPPTRLSEYELVGSGAALDDLSDTGTLSSLRRPGERARGNALSSGLAGGLEGLQPFDAATGAGSGIDAMRAFVNIEPPGGGAKRTPQARSPGPGARNPLSGIDLGPQANEWVDDAFKGIVNSVLHFDPNDRGRASFSLFGLGDFGVTVSSDRSEVALVSGDDVLLRAQRAMHAPGSAGSTQGNYRSEVPGWEGGHRGASGNQLVYGVSPLRQAIELALEIATHPISLLVYFIIAAYVTLWSLLKRHSRRKMRSARSQGRSHRSSSSSSSSRRRSGRGRRHRTSTHRPA